MPVREKGKDCFSFSFLDRFFSFSYRDFRETTGPTYAHTLTYWNVLAARLAFIIVFEHLIFFIIYLIQWIVPDVPKKIKEKIDHERFLDQSQRWANKDEKNTISSVAVPLVASNRIIHQEYNEKPVKSTKKSRQNVYVTPRNSKRD